jgi:hypothetical protein
VGVAIFRMKTNDKSSTDASEKRLLALTTKGSEDLTPKKKPP